MQQADERIDVSIVLPVFNEVDHLEEDVRRIQKSMAASELAFEIAVVDDGSTDGSGVLARSMDGVRVVRFATNRGTGSALAGVGLVADLVVQLNKKRYDALPATLE